MSKTCLAAFVKIAADASKSHMVQCFPILGGEGRTQIVGVHMPLV